MSKAVQSHPLYPETLATHWEGFCACPWARAGHLALPGQSQTKESEMTKPDLDQLVLWAGLGPWPLSGILSGFISRSKGIYAADAASLKLN